MRNASIVFLIAFSGFLASCGGGTMSSQCQIASIVVSPASAKADHTAVAPGNSVQFSAFQNSVGPGLCAQSNLLSVTWSLSDPVNATISNSHDQGNANFGRATCVNAAPAPITVTATAPTGTGTNLSASATLRCN
jgi:hypothetical protein